jgi:hypothetical protein
MGVLACHDFFRWGVGWFPLGCWLALRVVCEFICGDRWDGFFVAVVWHCHCTVLLFAFFGWSLKKVKRIFGRHGSEKGKCGG